MHATHLFDVVVPTFNNVDELTNCLESLEVQTLRDFRILVCVDGSTDGTAEALASRTGSIPLEVLWHKDRTNRGRSATRNLSLPRLDSDYTLFLDSDMMLNPNALERHAAVLGKRPSASIGAIRYRNAGTNLWARYKSVRRLSRWPSGSLLPPSQFITANAAVHTADVVALSGFDEKMSSYGGEDTEFGYRLVEQLARPIVSNPEAYAIAWEEKTLSAALSDLRSYGRINLGYLRRKHPSMKDAFRIEKYGSARVADRAFLAVMNPLTDKVVDFLLGFAPFRMQEQLINYKVVRAVFQGYAESMDGGLSAASGPPGATQ
jgi:glycosyltransferase involved in cell wall biosynthesis